MAAESKKRIMGLIGDDAVAWAWRQSNVDVVAAFPITPQTFIVETFDKFVANGLVDTEFITVESEHSAMSACVGASAAGARVATATAANGLALMWEILYIAASSRLPIVLNVANRALSSPINIHCDHSDAMGARDSGFIQIFVQGAQEAYDTTIMAFKLAEHEDVLLPVMVNLDGFIVSHNLERVELLPDDVVKKFLGVRKPSFKLDPKNPITIGPLALTDYYFEFKKQQDDAMKKVPEVYKKVMEEYEAISGRRYDIVEKYKTDDADVIMVILGSTAGTGKVVVDHLRKNGEKVGLLRLRMFRPFPVDIIRETLKDAKGVAVFDRAMSFGGAAGPIGMEVRTALYDLEKKPIITNFIYGLGGRDVPPELIVDGVRRTQKAIEKGKAPALYETLGVRE